MFYSRSEELESLPIYDIYYRNIQNGGNIICRVGRGYSPSAPQPPSPPTPY